MKQINENYTHPKNKNNSRSLTGLNSFCYLNPAFAKNESTAVESCKELMAHSTPQACFFMRVFRTPKKRLERFPMVGRNRKGFALCCVPLVAVFHPVTFYRQTVESLAVVPKKLLMELSQMLFKFPSTNSARPTFSKNHFTSSPAFGYALSAFAKSKAEPRNSNDLYLANNNTPPACFLVCCTRTPKENALSVLLSMVTCNGKGFALCCVPSIAVFEPVTRYRPQASKLQAVTLQNQYLEQITMLFKFLLLGETRLTISIRANSEQEARQRFKHSSPMIFIARINQGGVYA